MNTLSLLLAALGVAMFLEGLPYFISPAAVRRYMSQVQQLGDGTLRLLGVLLMAGGLLVAYFSLH